MDWPDKFEVEFFLILYRKGQKEGKLLKSCFPTLVLSNSRKVQEILYFFYWYRPRTFFFSKAQMPLKRENTRARIFSSAADFLKRELTGKVCQDFATLVYTEHSRVAKNGAHSKIHRLGLFYLKATIYNSVILFCCAF